MKNEKKTRNYEKPEVEVIKLDKEASFMTQSPVVINQAVGGSNEVPGGDCALLE